MSAWNVLSSIGVFPVQPGYATWGLSTPVFERVDLTLDRRYYPHGSLTIKAPGTSDTRRYIQSARVDGSPYGRTYLTTGDLRSARSLSFTLGTEPSTWGTGAEAGPPALN
ncbi:glycoside hydrolase domain-containing protein [Streptomyces anandii]